jgi:hypothetical protein
VSKQTLIRWSKELSREIANRRAIEVDELQEKYFAQREKRIELFGETLKSIKLELGKMRPEGPFDRQVVRPAVEVFGRIEIGIPRHHVFR